MEMYFLVRFNFELTKPIQIFWKTQKNEKNIILPWTIGIKCTSKNNERDIGKFWIKYFNIYDFLINIIFNDCHHQNQKTESKQATR